MWLEFWSNIAVVWLALLCFATLLVPIVALYFMIRGLTMAQDHSRILFEKAQKQTGTMRTKTDQVSERIASPLLNMQVRSARFGSFVRTLWPRKRKS